MKRTSIGQMDLLRLSVELGHSGAKPAANQQQHRKCRLHDARIRTALQLKMSWKKQHYLPAPYTRVCPNTALSWIIELCIPVVIWSKIWLKARMCGDCLSTAVARALVTLFWSLVGSVLNEARYIAVIFLRVTHETHAIARPSGWGMGCRSWVQGLIEALRLKLFRCAHCRIKHD